MAPDRAMVAMLVEAQLVPHVQEFLALARKMLQSPTTAREEPARAANVFRHDGNLWQIGYAGTTTFLPHIVGMGYIASLLAAPGVQFDCQQLDQSIRDAGDYEPAVDRATLKAYALRVEELDTMDADGPLPSELAHERTQVKEELRRTKRLGGRPRPIVRARERSRVRVSKAIDRAICSIETRNQRLGAHLRQAIRRGGTLVYYPESPIQWEF